jgi:hypothetical protein
VAQVNSCEHLYCHDLTRNKVAQVNSCEILRAVEKELNLVNSIEHEELKEILESGWEFNEHELVLLGCKRVGLNITNAEEAHCVNV